MAVPGMPNEAIANHHENHGSLALQFGGHFKG